MKPMPVHRRHTAIQIFAVPLLLAILSIIGLESALVGDGAWGGLSWIALGIPIVLCGYFLLKRS